MSSQSESSRADPQGGVDDSILSRVQGWIAAFKTKNSLFSQKFEAKSVASSNGTDATEMERAEGSEIAAGVDSEHIPQIDSQIGAQTNSRPNTSTHQSENSTIPSSTSAATVEERPQPQCNCSLRDMFGKLRKLLNTDDKPKVFRVSQAAQQVQARRNALEIEERVAQLPSLTSTNRARLERGTTNVDEYLRESNSK